jgi:subtilisin
MKTRLRSKLMSAGLVMALNIGVAQAADQYGGRHSDVDASGPQAEAASYTILMDKAHTRGSVRVIVKLRTDFQVEEQLASAQAVQSQRTTITQLQQKVMDTLAHHPVQSAKRYKYIPYMAMEVDALALQDLGSSSAVMDIMEDIPQPPALSDSIPLIGADSAWSAGYSGAGQAVAILDTGVDKDHKFLSGKVVAEACFSTSGSDGVSTTLCPNGKEQQIGSGAGVHCSSAYGCDHGTHVAGIAAGDYGVAREADIIAVQVFSQFNSPDSCGDLPAPCVLTYPSDQLSALEWVYEQRNRADIASVNMSLGGGEYDSRSDCDQENAAIKDAIDNLRSMGIATVMSSGNDGYIDGIGGPACISSAISVGATDKQDNVADFSNSADFLDLLAPGVAINSSVPGDVYASYNGTSMAAPHVAGAWAVLKSMKSNASVDEILSALVSTGKSVTDHRNGITKPRIQLDALVGNGGGDDVAPLNQLTPSGTIAETMPTY